jgi:hypothetical protein
MRVFTKRNAVLGWLVARIARRRLERRLNRAAGNPTGRWRLAIGTLVAAGTAVAGALVARRVAGAASRTA